MSWNKGRKRKCVVIDRDFQFAYLMTWIVMTMALLTGLVLASLTMFFVFRVQAPIYLLIANGACAVGITLVSMRVMVGHSHRIAGPAFRLERTIRHIADGKETEHVKLRRKDYLKHIAEAVNHLIDRQKEREEEREEERERLRAKVEEIETALEAGHPYIENLRELSEQLRAKPAQEEAKSEELERPVEAVV